MQVVVGPARARADRGVGLGLAVTRDLCEPLLAPAILGRWVVRPSARSPGSSRRSRRDTRLSKVAAPAHGRRKGSTDASSRFATAIGSNPRVEPSTRADATAIHLPFGATAWAAEPATRKTSLSRFTWGKVQGRFREGSGKVQGRFREDVALAAHRRAGQEELARVGILALVWRVGEHGVQPHDLVPLRHGALGRVPAILGRWYRSATAPSGAYLPY